MDASGQQEEHMVPPEVVGQLGNGAVNTGLERQTSPSSTQADIPKSPAQSTQAGKSNGHRRLSGYQQEKLAHRLLNKLSHHHDDHGHHHHGASTTSVSHGHGEKPKSILTAAASGVVNYLLMFGLCAAYGLIMFSDEYNEMHSVLAVKMNLGCSMIVGLTLAFRSKIPVAIGGPDLNPVVLLGGFIDSMQVAIAADLNLELPTGRRLAGSSSGGSGFCGGAHLAAHLEQCEAFHKQLRATAIFATALSSFIFVILFVLFGRFKLTRYVSYIPTSIMEAFLSCVGYKVFLYALKFCKYDPYQFVPAACIGVPLYFMKAYHVGHPGLVMPLGFLLPLAFFYVVTYGFMGSDVDTARKDKLMFPKMDNIHFWHVWTDSIGSPENINLKAWVTTLPNLAIMIVLVLLDCLLKVNATESKLHLKVDKDYEVQLHGMSNILTTLTGSSVGYMQLKFNVINAGVMQNMKDRRGGMIYAILCGVCYFGTIAPINFMPRFFVGSLLFFAGAGFVCENLWGSRKYLHPMEWFEVLLILAVFIITGSLLLAVITGGVICGISFIVKYAHVPTIEGRPMRGADLRVVERRGPLLLRNIRHITESWLLVVRLKGYVFFASAQSLTAHVLSIIQDEEEEGIPLYRRLRLVVFDCKLLDGLDASASKALAGFVRDAKEHRVKVLWSSLSPAFHDEIKNRGILLSEKNVLVDLDEAVMSVEELAKRYLAGIEQRWIGLHKSFEDNKRMTVEHYAFEPFMQVFLSTTGRIGCPWKYCERLTIEGGQTILWAPGDMNGMLYLVHSGAVGLFAKLPKDHEHWSMPVAVYKHGWFLNRETIMRMPSRFYGVALEDGELLCWSQERWWDMTVERPLMMSEILKAVMKQQAGDCDTMDVHTHGGVAEEDETEEAAWDGVFHASSFADAKGLTTLTNERFSRGVVGEQFGDLPEILTTRLQNLETATRLADLEFYNPVPEGETPLMPELPSFVHADLDVAWATYMSDDYMAAHQISKALMFAGVFDYSGSFTPSAFDSYTKDEFMDIGQTALMAPFCQRDLQTIERIFSEADEDKDGSLNRHELQTFLQQTLSKDVHMEEVDGIVLAWGKLERGIEQLDVQLDLPTIISVMSLFVRKHEHFWHMLQGFEEVLGRNPIKEPTRLTADMLRQNKNVDLSLQEAEEMIWAANWRTDGQGVGGLPWTEFVSAIYLCVMRPAGMLPPAPVFRGTSYMNRAPTHTHHADPSRTVSNFSNTGSALASSEGPMRMVRQLSDLEVDEDLMSATQSKDPWLGIALVDEPDAPTTEENPSKDESVQRTGVSFKERMSFVIEHPGRSRVGRVMRFVGYLVIVASVMETILEPFISGSDKERSETEKQLWFDLECAVTGMFTVEIIIRTTLARPGLANLVTTWKYCCLVLATLPLYLELIMGTFMDENSVVYRAINLLRLARLARLSRLAHSHPILEAIVVSLVVIWGIFKKHALDEPA